ncbi:MAG TPA: hypothetical protein VKP30_10260, partial [Polyangiaceae bacterium]|nr:hypothetical protein [Polyangiaceae bacterium]
MKARVVARIPRDDDAYGPAPARSIALLASLPWVSPKPQVAPRLASTPHLDKFRILVCAGCLTANSPAWAVPTFGVIAEGTCPSQEELTQAVVAKGWSQVPRLTNSIDRRDYDRDYD